MRCRPALPCIALLLLAGCTSFGGGVTTADTPADTPTVTETTVPPTDATPTPETTTDGPDTTTGTATPSNDSSPAANAYPPGVGPDGLTNHTALELANRDTLLETGYAAAGTRNLTTEVGTRNTSVRAVVETGGYPYHTVTRDVVNGSLGRETATWANETVGLTRYRGDDSVEYRNRYDPDAPTAAATELGLFTALEGGDWETVAVEGAPDARRLTLRATTPDPTGERPPEATLTGYDGRLVVSENGTIHRANVTVDIEMRGANHTVRFAYGLTATGGATVDRPAWVDERIRDVLNVSVRAAAVDDRFVRVENTGRTAIEPGSEFLLWYGGCGRATGDLEAPLAPGEAVYVYVENGTYSDLGFNHTGPSGPAESISHPSDLIVYPPAGDDERPDPVARADVAEVDATNASASGSAALPLAGGATRLGSAVGC
jgi:hypothetical protein